MRIVFSAVLFLITIGTNSDATVRFDDVNVTAGNVITVLDLLPLLQGSNYVCVVSRNRDILSDIFEVIKNEYKSVVLGDFCKSMLDTFDSVLMIEMDLSVCCSAVFAKVSRASVYIINSEVTLTDVTYLEQCVANISSPEVISVSLLDGTVFALSPVFPSPRRLTKISVAHVIQRRAHPEKKDLDGTIINAVAINDPPFAIIQNNTKQEDFDGQLVVLFRELARQLNFTIRYHTYRNWGVLLPNGTYVSGMGQAIQKGKGDVAVTFVWQIPSDSYLVDFGTPLDVNELRILVRRPKKMVFQWHTFLTLMEPTVWLATMIAFILVVIIFWLDIWLDHLHIESWAESILTVFGHFIMATSHRKNGRNTRYILTVWSTFSLLIGVYYSSLIVTRLTLPTFSPRVDTVRQLVEGGYYWTVQYYGQLTTAEFKESVFDFENEWHYKFEKTYRYMNAKEVEAKVRYEEKLTFLSNKYENDVVALTTEGLYGNEAVEMYRVARGLISKNYVTFGVKKNSTILEPLSVIAQRYLEVGLMKVWMDQVLRRWPIYDNKKLLVEEDITVFNEAQQLRLQNVLPFFYLLLLGLSIGSLVFFVEVMWRT